MGGGGRKTRSGLILAMMRLWTILFPFFGLQFILILQRAQSLEIGPLPHSVPDHTSVTLGEKEVAHNTCSRIC